MQLNGIPLENYTFTELYELKTKAEQLILIKSEEEEKETLEKIAETIRKNKIPYAKIMRMLREENAIYAPLDSDGYARPIYYNPKNPTEVFDGQGRQPNWVKKLTDSGEKLSDYIINKDAVFNPRSDND